MHKSYFSNLVVREISLSKITKNVRTHSERSFTKNVYKIDVYHKRSDSTFLKSRSNVVSMQTTVVPQDVEHFLPRTV